MSSIIRSYHKATKPPEDGKEAYYPVHHCMDYAVSNFGTVKNAFTHEIVQPLHYHRTAVQEPILNF